MQAVRSYCLGARERRQAVDSFGSRGNLQVGSASYEIFRLSAVPGSARLPFSLKVLLENLLRTEDGANITADHVRALGGWNSQSEPDTEIQFTPARVLMQDFTGVPCVVDLAAMREAMVALGGDPERINPLSPAELVIDHSVIADVFGREDAFVRNAELEFERNAERYQFLRWGQRAFADFKVVPPDTGICHQVNLEYLSRVVFDRDGVAYPDTLVGTDSHTTMVNGLAVLGWGVGGIEAEAAMLGQPISMLIPRVVGFKLSGALPDGATATDLVLTVTEMLRRHGVVGKFVEFYGPGVTNVPLANRATIGNMSPEYGSTCAIFPIDDETLRYLKFTGRSPERIALVEAYAKEQGLWHDPAAEPDYSERLELDLSTVVPSLAGPKRPQDRVSLSDAKASFRSVLGGYVQKTGGNGSLDEGSEESFPASDPVAIDHEHAEDKPAGVPSAATDRKRPPERSRHGHSRRRHGLRDRPRCCRHCRHHELHEHLEPFGHDRRRAGGEKRCGERAFAQALGEDDTRSRLEGGHRLLRRGGVDALSGEARLQPGRLRLHDLHRQLRPARRRDLEDHRRPRHRGRRGALGQPQLRGPHPP